VRFFPLWSARRQILVLGRYWERADDLKLAKNCPHPAMCFIHSYNIPTYIQKACHAPGFLKVAARAVIRLELTFGAKSFVKFGWIHVMLKDYYTINFIFHGTGFYWHDLPHHTLIMNSAGKEKRLLYCNNYKGDFCNTFLKSSFLRLRVTFE